MTIVSRHSYSETIDLLQAAMKNGGNTIFAVIDQAAAAASAGLTLRPTTLVIFGNPKGGTPLMEAFPMTALELPLKMVVWEEGDVVNVSYVPASEIAARYGVSGMEARIQGMDAALSGLAASVT